jgi:hypothetical protein
MKRRSRVGSGSGAMTINIVDGRRFYQFAYTLGGK